MATAIPSAIELWKDVRETSLTRQSATCILCELFGVSQDSVAGKNLVTAFEESAIPLLIPTMVDDDLQIRAFILAKAQRIVAERTDGLSLAQALETDSMFCTTLAHDASARARQIQKEQRGEKKK